MVSPLSWDEVLEEFLRAALDPLRVPRLALRHVSTSPPPCFLPERGYVEKGFPRV